MNTVTPATTLSYLCPLGSSNIWSSCRRLALCSLMLLGALLASNSAQAQIKHKQAEIKVGDILVFDNRIPLPPALLVVNPKTGQRTVLTDFANPAQGSIQGSLQALAGVAVGAEGQIFVSEQLNYALFGVDPDSGYRTLVSEFWPEGDIVGAPYWGLAVDAKGRVILNGQWGAPLFPWAVLSVDPLTDQRVLVSDFQNPAQGPSLGNGNPTDLTLDKSGNILVGANVDYTHSAIFRVNPKTGKRRLLSDSANPAQGTDGFDLLSGAVGMAVEASGQILANSVGYGGTLLLRIDPRTGNRTVLSDFDNPAQGELGQVLAGIGVEKSGRIVVGAHYQGDDPATVLFRVDPETGRRTVLSDSRDLSQGMSFYPSYIAVVTSDSETEGHH